MNEFDQDAQHVRAITQVLNEQARDLDASSLSRLNRARQAALAQLDATHWWQQLFRKPMWALASVALVFAMGAWMLHISNRQIEAPAAYVTDAELEALWDGDTASVIDDAMAADDDELALARELDFYAWLAASEPQSDAGGI